MNHADTRRLVGKLWNYCDVLRDDGVSDLRQSVSRRLPGLRFPLP